MIQQRNSLVDPMEVPSQLVGPGGPNFKLRLKNKQRSNLFLNYQVQLFGRVEVFFLLCFDLLCFVFFKVDDEISSATT